MGRPKRERKEPEKLTYEVTAPAKKKKKVTKKKPVSKKKAASKSKKKKPLFRHRRRRKTDERTRSGFGGCDGKNGAMKVICFARSLKLIFLFQQFIAIS